MLSAQSIMFFMLACVMCAVVSIIKIVRAARFESGQVRRIILFFTFVASICGVVSVTLLPIETQFLREFPTISINYIPLSSITTFFSSLPASGSIEMEVFSLNFFGNIAIFVPFGFLVGMLFRRCQKLPFVTLYAAIFSVAIEIAQLAEQVAGLTISRATDVDDVILNVIGALVGFAVYKLFFAKSNLKYLHRHYKYSLED